MRETDELIVAFRTHLWSEDIASLAHRLRNASAGARFVIIADETSETLDTQPFEKLAHGNDFTSYALPNFPAGKVLWYNADYPLYVLRRQFPRATHFAMVEYDVAVNIDFFALMRHVQCNKIDFLAPKTFYASPSWYWFPTVSPHFARPMQALISTMIISGRAIDALLLRRQGLAAGKIIQRHIDWPFCEGFIPSAVRELPGARFGYMSQHAALPHYTWNHVIHLSAPEASAPGTICHPVLAGKAFIEKAIAAAKVEEVFDPGAKLSRQLAFCQPGDFIEPLTNHVKSARSAALLERFKALAAAQGWPVDGIKTNLAFAKPTLQSSTCKWSRSPDPKIDSLGGNNGRVTGGFGFHTDFETDPWWQVDLEDDFLITKLRVFNRMGFNKRCTRIAVYSSHDGTDWICRGAKLDASLFGGADGNPYVFTFAPAFAARLIRIGMIGEGYLHLDEIEVDGVLNSTPQATEPAPELARRPGPGRSD